MAGPQEFAVTNRVWLYIKKAKFSLKKYNETETHPNGQQFLIKIDVKATLDILVHKKIRSTSRLKWHKIELLIYCKGLRLCLL